MQVSSMLSEGQDSRVQPSPFIVPTGEGPAASRQYTTRQTAPDTHHHPDVADSGMHKVYPSTETDPSHELRSPIKSNTPCKHVSFELLLPQSQRRARLPMRVNIYQHDTIGDIIITVKNFYGLYHAAGVSFEDAQGNTLIARYENFDHNMVVYVRVLEDEPEMDDGPDDGAPVAHQSMSPRRPRMELGYQMLPPALDHRHARPDSHGASRKSQSPPPGRGRRSTSASTNTRSRPRYTTKSRGASSHTAHGSFADGNTDANNYSDSDCGDASVTSSRRGKKEQVASADISVDNIVEGGRRKRAKFDSSELPLFVPPQIPMTASLSSVSPQRRISNQNCASPYNNQQTFAYSHPLPSPQSYGQGETYYVQQGLATPYTTSSGAQGFRSRTRGSGQFPPYRQSGNSAAMLPTPDATLSASVISDEDVARQLMRLGDASNFSTHGRTSTSTLDDALSGKAELASSSEESEEESADEHELPPLPYSLDRTQGMSGDMPRAFDSAETSGDDYDDNRDHSFKGESDEIGPAGHQHHRVQASGAKGRSSVSVKAEKSGKQRSLSKGHSKMNTTAKQPISPTSLPPQSRKASNASLHFQHQLGVDEEDLSSKPRCQRCRKSKKGCDRQRPCQRCKDAGIGVDGCISEDEGNGRKGRYGRHMGVPVKRSHSEALSATESAFPVGAMPHNSATGVAMEKTKKRKR